MGTLVPALSHSFLVWYRVAGRDPQMKVVTVARVSPSGPSWASSGTLVPNGPSGRLQGPLGL